MKYIWIIHFKTLSFASVLNIEIIFNTKTMESTVLQFNSVYIHLRAEIWIWWHFRIWARWCKTLFFTKHYDACLLQTHSQWVVLIRGKYVVYFHNLNIFRKLKLQRHLSEKYHSKLTCHLIWVVQLELTEAVL